MIEIVRDFFAGLGVALLLAAAAVMLCGDNGLARYFGELGALYCAAGLLAAFAEEAAQLWHGGWRRGNIAAKPQRPKIPARLTT